MSETKKRPIGLFESLRAIHQCRKLQDLIRHHNNWAPQLPLARPLSKFGISETDSNRKALIEKQINELLPVAQICAKRAKMSLSVIVKEEVYPRLLPHEYKDVEYNIFANYTKLMSIDDRSATFFNLEIGKLDQLIGFYSEAWLRILINPLKWVAIILRIPISILEHMGFDSTGRTTELVLSFIMRFLWILVLAFLTVYYAGKSQLIQAFLQLW